MNRKFGNGAIRVLINGKEAPTIGNICMDACMIDVTDVECAVGDEVEIFGENMPIERLSDVLGTIPYEVLTSVSPRVKRIYFRE
jgi:alanine racemase